MQNIDIIIVAFLLWTRIYYICQENKHFYKLIPLKIHEREVPVMEGSSCSQDTNQTFENKPTSNFCSHCFEGQDKNKLMFSFKSYGIQTNIKPNYYFVLFCFSRQDFSTYAWLSWNQLCRTGCPQTHRDSSTSASRVLD